MTDALPERDHPAAGQLASRRGTSSPRGHGAFDFVWTHFGFEDDSAGDDAAAPAPGQPVRPGRLRLGRRRRGDRVLAAGVREPRRTTATLASSAAATSADTDHMVTETLIRGMYRYWREVMEAEAMARDPRIDFADCASRSSSSTPTTPAPSTRGDWDAVAGVLHRRLRATGCSRARTTSAASRSHARRSRARAC